MRYLTLFFATRFLLPVFGAKIFIGADVEAQWPMYILGPCAVTLLCVGFTLAFTLELRTRASAQGKEASLVFSGYAMEIGRATVEKLKRIEAIKALHIMSSHLGRLLDKRSP